MMRLLLCFLVILVSAPLRSQGRAWLETDSIRIGEQTRVTYEFAYDNNRTSVRYRPFHQSIPCGIKINRKDAQPSGQAELEIIGKFKDTLFKRGKSVVWQGYYLLTAWDTGVFLLPQARLVYDDSMFLLPEVLLDVLAPRAEPGKDIHDIQESFAEIRPGIGGFWDTYGLYVLIGGIGLAALLLWLIFRKKQPAVPKLPPTLREVTLLGLDTLEKQQAWQHDLKAFYVELSFLLRSYLSKRYTLNLLERTSHETALLLRQKNLADDTIQLIRLILDYADMAKFAKATSDTTEIQRNILRVRQIIHETSPIELTPHAS